jgi:predicted carbohydrate-binding protein with CBM5 and CBM33 domain
MAALQHRPPRLIIDMREFRGRPSNKLLAFRDDVTVPKYERAGMKKLAWVWPRADAGNMGTGAAYDQRYFESRDEAIAWTQARG